MSLHGALKAPPEKYTSQFHTGIKFSDQYAGHLLALDEAIRKIYDVLKANGEDQNTLFMLSADNGQSKYRVPPYNAPYRGGKGTGWLGGTHEPLIIYWPAQLHAGWHDELVSTMDIFATALDAAGLSPTKPIDGRSLLPLMKGETKIGPHEELFSAGLHSTYFSDSYFPGDTEEIERGGKETRSDEKKCPLYAWRQDDSTVLTYITRTVPGLYPEFPQGRPEQRLYFNLKSDPQEDTNLFADTPAVEKASSDLGDWLKTTKPPLIEHAADYKQLFQMAPSSTQVP
jgi:arylsulfatase A-like enzyme